MSLGRGFERASLQVLLRELEDVVLHCECKGVSDAAPDHGARHGIAGEVLHVVIRLPGKDEIVHGDPLKVRMLSSSQIGVLLQRNTVKVLHIA